MYTTTHYDYIVRKLRHFFQTQKGFIEVPAQPRLSILAACEDPSTIAQYSLGGTGYPLPQTGQMWLEYEMLKNPTWPGVFCITTSYRDEPNPIEGRHQRIFPMFEFESRGEFKDMKKLEIELVTFLGFDAPVSIEYEDACTKYQVPTIEAPQEFSLESDLGSAVLLERFPERTNPFWNMKYSGEGKYNKIDVILHGMETIGSAERETDVERMFNQFHVIKNGEYASLLYTKFGKERVLKELEAYLALPMIKRFGAGIGMTRLERAMQLAGIFDKARISSGKEQEILLTV